MTLRKDPMDPLSATYSVAAAYPGGIPALAGRLGIAASTLYALLRGSEALTVDRMVAITHFAAQAGVPHWQAPMHALAAAHDGVFVPAPPRASDQPVSQVAEATLRAVAEFGDVARVAGNALADGVMTRHEAAQLEHEAYEAMQAIAALVASAHAVAR